PCQQVDQFKLGGVRILVLVDHDVAKLPPAGLERFRVLLKQFQGQEKQVVKIDGIAGSQRAFVPRPNMLRQHGGTFVRKRFRFDQPTLEPAQERKNDLRIGLFPFGGNLAQNLLHRAELLRLVIDDEVFLVAELFDVAAKNSHTERVKSANR